MIKLINDVLRLCGYRLIITKKRPNNLEVDYDPETKAEIEQQIRETEYVSRHRIAEPDASHQYQKMLELKQELIDKENAIRREYIKIRSRYTEQLHAKEITLEEHNRLRKEAADECMRKIAELRLQHWQ